MQMFESMDAIRDILIGDDELWKLLYYKPKHGDDDPLQRGSVLESVDVGERHLIINKRLKHTPVTDDLGVDGDEGICRIIFYPAPRRPQSGNYAIARQRVNFDIFVHHSFNDVDMRLSKICDRVNKIIFNERISGIGGVTFVDGNPFVMSDEGYIGYTLTYEFGSVI